MISTKVVNTDEYYGGLKPEIKEWLDENIGLGGYHMAQHENQKWACGNINQTELIEYNGSYVRFRELFFTSLNDLILFKLKWG